MVSDKEYIAALATIREYGKQVKEKTQQAFKAVTDDLNAYFNETGQISMLDFELLMDMNGAIRITFKALESEDLTGEEPFLEKLDEIGKKHDIIIRVPYFYFMK